MRDRNRMGLFNRPDPKATAPSPPPRISPVSRDRIEDYLRSRDFKYFVDEDGDVGGMWEGRMFFFLFYGSKKEILQVRGRWNHHLDLDQTSELRLAVNDWNRDHYWPKVYTQSDPTGLSVYAEVSTDLEHGVSDDQLAQLVDCGLYTGLQFFDALDKRFPEATQKDD